MADVIAGIASRSLLCSGRTESAGAAEFAQLETGTNKTDQLLK